MRVLQSARLSGLLSGVAEVSAQVGGGVVGDDPGLIFFFLGGDFGILDFVQGGREIYYYYIVLLACLFCSLLGSAYHAGMVATCC